MTGAWGGLCVTVTLCPMPFYVILFVTESIFLWPNVSIAGEWSGIIIIARKLSRRCGETPSSGGELTM